MSQASSAAAAAIDIGPIVGQLMLALATVFAPIVAKQIVSLLSQLAKKNGLEVKAAQLARLQDLLVNGINAGAAIAAAKSQGISPIELKNQTAAAAIDYVKTHGGDLLKSIGVDLSDRAQVAELEDALRARIERALNDPAIPTPPAITPIGSGGSLLPDGSIYQPPK